MSTGSFYPSLRLILPTTIKNVALRKGVNGSGAHVEDTRWRTDVKQHTRRRKESAAFNPATLQDASSTFERVRPLYSEESRWISRTRGIFSTESLIREIAKRARCRYPWKWRTCSERLSENRRAERKSEVTSYDSLVRLFSKLLGI